MSTSTAAVRAPSAPEPTSRTRGLALITGASAGLGREFATQLAALGYDLVLVARDKSRLDTLANQLAAAHGIRCEVLPADLASDAGVERARERAACGDLTLLVNNAGFGTVGSMARVSLESQEAMLRLHVLVPNALSHAVLPGMLQRAAGAILNVSSVASFVTSAGNVNYCASKAYLRTFSEALAQEVGGRGVTVQALCPGFTRTEFHERGAMDMRRVPAFLWLDARRVVEESLRALDRGRPVVVVPGRRWRAIVFLLRHAPLWMRTRGARRYRRDAPRDGEAP